MCWYTLIFVPNHFLFILVLILLQWCWADTSTTKQSLSSEICCSIVPLRGLAEDRALELKQ